MRKKKTKKRANKKVLEEKTTFRPNSNLEFKEPLKDGLLEKYELNAEGATVFVSIEKKDKVIKYIISIPEIDPATKILMREIRNELVSFTTVSMKELTDQESFFKIKDRDYDYSIEFQNIVAVFSEIISFNTSWSLSFLKTS